MYVYAIRDSELARIKVGRSASPLQRLRELGGELLGAVEVADPREEQRVHADLGHLRIEGEWFADDAEAILSVLARRGPVLLAELPSPPLMLRASLTEREWADIRKAAIDSRISTVDLVTDLIRRGLASRRAEAAAA